jgi:tetratricopeptide (TPR) repeat protein
MRSVHHDRIGLVAAALLSLAVGAAPALAVGTEEPPAPVTKPEDKKADEKKPEQKGTETKGTETKGDDKDKKPEGEKKSERDFRDGYTLLQSSRYDDAIVAFRVLGHDDHPDVANSIGFASRKLGRYDDAKVWYEKALAADPRHVRTWSYYGMWHAEQGNRLKAEDFLQKVVSICGNTSCREYTELKGVIEGTATY